MAALGEAAFIHVGDIFAEGGDAFVLQAAQAVAPPRLKEPALHAAHVADDVAPTAAEERPGAHATHAGNPAPLHVPAGQSVQPVPAEKTEPAAHGAAGTDATTLLVPVT